MNALQLLKDFNYTPVSDLNYCTKRGVEYYIGVNGNQAAIAAMIYDDNLYFITKQELVIMAESAKTKGIDKVHLLTNYGIELESKYEKPTQVGLSTIKKIITDWNLEVTPVY